ncbi:MAG TPA: cell division protein ZipA, partial [Gammaproteobacteria bacterium]|nr:cell division protein ZipA [Gammaproteobacteria bacterium]
EKFSTPGLVLFLQLPSLIDGPSAFDLFLRRARRIAEVLPGDLYSDRKELLDDDGIDRLRQLVAAFDNAH